MDYLLSMTLVLYMVMSIQQIFSFSQSLFKIARPVASAMKKTGFVQRSAILDSVGLMFPKTRLAETAFFGLRLSAQIRQ
jgi:hypothetical protein